MRLKITEKCPGMTTIKMGDHKSPKKDDAFVILHRLNSTYINFLTASIALS